MVLHFAWCYIGAVREISLSLYQDTIFLQFSPFLKRIYISDKCGEIKVRVVHDITTCISLYSSTT